MNCGAMLEDFLEKIRGIDFEDFGSLTLNRVDWEGKNLTLWLKVFDEYRPELPSDWQIVASGVRGEQLTFGYCSSVELSHDHVLLWSHVAKHTSTSFYGKTKEPNTVVGSLYKRHKELVGNWIPFHRFFNSEVELTELIAGGFGMLAEGPEKLISAYEEVMSQHGFSTSHHESRPALYWDGEAWKENEDSLSVLIFDDSYVIAERFTAKAPQINE